MNDMYRMFIVTVSGKSLKEDKQTLFAPVDYLSSGICFKSNKILFKRWYTDEG